MTGFRKTLFGDDGTGGVVGCLKNKVSKTALWTVIVVIGIPLFITGVKVWSSNEASELRFAAATEMHAIKERMSVSEAHFKSMCESLADIKLTLIEVRKDIKRLDRPHDSQTNRSQIDH